MRNQNLLIQTVGSVSYWIRHVTYHESQFSKMMIRLDPIVNVVKQLCKNFQIETTPGIQEY